MAFADFWRLMAAIGDFEVWLAIVFLILALYAVFPKSKKHRIAFLVFVLVPSLFISAGITELLKIYTQIPRPCLGQADCPSNFSFPSGHAAAMFALAAAVALNNKNLGIKSAFAILAILVSISRVALNYHTYADIIGGAFVGISTVYLIEILYKRNILSLKAFKSIIS